MENNTTGTSSFDQWGFPDRVNVEEFEDRIEMTFVETSCISLTVYPPRPPERRVFKITFSCVDGKWNKSGKIYGEIVPAEQESYDFD